MFYKNCTLAVQFFINFALSQCNFCYLCTFQFYDYGKFTERFFIKDGLKIEE